MSCERCHRESLSAKATAIASERQSTESDRCANIGRTRLSAHHLSGYHHAYRHHPTYRTCFIQSQRHATEDQDTETHTGISTSGAEEPRAHQSIGVGVVGVRAIQQATGILRCRRRLLSRSNGRACVSPTSQANEDYRDWGKQWGTV